MIVKKIKCKKTSKTKARQIADLVDYIRQPKGGQSTEKVEHSGSQNFLASRHEGQRLEMIALAAESIHSRMPVSHYVFSWRRTSSPRPVRWMNWWIFFSRSLALKVVRPCTGCTGTQRHSPGRRRKGRRPPCRRRRRLPARYSG